MGYPIYSVGHSDLTLDAFLALLCRHNIGAVADVRSSPYSRHVPQFNKESLGPYLKEHGIEHVFLGRELGARRVEKSCYVNGRAVYEKIAELGIFKDGIQRLCRGSEKMRIAIMCTEKDPLFCHRCVLVSRALVRLGNDVMHIHSDGHLESHVEVEDRMILQVGIEPDFFEGGNDREVLVSRAYRAHGLRLAVEEEVVENEAVHNRVY